MRFLVRYLDGLVEPLFKQDAQGRTVFYPVGVLWRGHVLPDRAAVDRMRRTARATYVVMFLVLIPSLGAANAIAGGLDWRHLAVALGAGLGLGGLQVLWLRSRVSGYPVSDERLRWGEAAQAQSRALGRGWLGFLLAGSLLMMAGGVAVVAFDPGRNLASGLFATLFFAACSVLFWRQFRQLDAARGR